MNLGFDAKRAFFNRTGLGNFSRWHISLMEQCLDHAKITLFAPNAENQTLFLENGNCSVVTTGPGLQGNWRRVFPGSLLRKSGINVYHGLSNELPLGNSWNRGLKTVLTVHDLIFERYPELYDPVSRRIYSYKLKSSVEKADLIHCVSASTSKDLQNIYHVPADRIRVIPLGMGLLNHNQGFDNTPMGEQNDVPYFLCVSGLEKRKNLVRLIEAFAQSEVSIDHQLIIAGKKGDAVDLVNRAKDFSSKKDRIKVLENVSSKQLAVLYQNASAFVYPSLYEGFGIPILEALNFNLPIFTSQSSSMPEVAGNCAVYFDPSITESMVAALNQYGNSDVVNRILSNIPKQKELFKDQAIAEIWKRLYAELLV